MSCTQARNGMLNFVADLSDDRGAALQHKRPARGETLERGAVEPLNPVEIQSGRVGLPGNLPTAVRFMYEELQAEQQGEGMFQADSPASPLQQVQFYQVCTVMMGCGQLMPHIFLNT